MIAIIPVAGSGTRLRPLTHSKPKALVQVGSKPIISHIIDTLIPIGCTKVVLIVSHEGENIPYYVKSRYPGLEVETVVQEDRLGLGHAVSLTRTIAAGREIVVMYGDTILDGDFTSFLGDGADGIIAVKEVDDPRRFGVVNVENGIITKFVEKPSRPETNLAIVGFNWFKSSDVLFSCLDEIIDSGVMTKGEFQITDAFQCMIERGYVLRPYTINGWFDCGTPQSLLETNRFMLAREEAASTVDGSITIPPVYIPESARVSHSIIGPNVSVGEHAVVERTIVADSIIGGGAHVKNACLNGSLVGDNAQVIERPRILAIGDNSSLDFEIE